MEFGLPPNATFCLVLGRLFKLHPMFDEALFDILQSTPDNVYILFVREKNGDMNRLLADRWANVQEERCCQREGQRGEGGAMGETSCCGNMKMYRQLYFQRHQTLMKNGDSSLADADINMLSKMSNISGTSSHADYVLHRVRFIQYDAYVDALLNARAVLDTFPYGGM